MYTRISCLDTYNIKSMLNMCKLVGFNRSLHRSTFGLFIFVYFIQSICWACYFSERVYCYLSLENLCFEFIFI